MMMKLSTLRYLFKEGIVGLWRNRTMALASIGTIVLCLIILGMSYGIGTNIDYLIEQVETKFGVTAYLQEDLTKEQTETLQNKIEAMPNVAEVTYISKEEALKSFSEENSNQSLFTMFQQDNPLPASFEITTTEIDDQPKLIQELNNMEGIEETIYFQNETASFIHIRNTINYVCLGIMACLIIVGLLLMSNTIKLTVYVRRREINIMKYVGATDAFIQVPFLIEGGLIGFLGALISIVIVTLTYDQVREKAVTMTGVLGELSLLPTADIIHSLMPMYFGLGIGIGLIGSAFAIHKHLNV